jgi:hypothetical protein
MISFRPLAISLLIACRALASAAQDQPITPAPADGYRGVWYMNQPQNDRFKYKYSGGLATYPQQHVPIAVYAPAANKTFFCYGGKTGDANRISNMVSYYDHDTGRVPRPAVLLSRATNDLHYNPTLTIDDKGHLYVFCNSHGIAGNSFIFRSTQPNSIDSFEKVYEGNFSYSQAWSVEGKGILWLHTRYEEGKRRLYWSNSADGRQWQDPKPLARMKSGDYQISWAQGHLVGTAMDHHPEKGGLNARTNIYYLQTTDFAQTWTTAAGEKLNTPLFETTNRALVHDFEKEGLLVYLKDLAFDAESRPVILYLSAKGHASGPVSGPRIWETIRWTGAAWQRRRCFESDHNYDHGSLYIEPDGTWRIIAPTDPGPQDGTTGGQITVHTSKDQGQTWTKTATLPTQNNRNQTYVRRPWRAHESVYALWADGDALNPSESDLYFCDKDGTVFRLPRKIDGDSALPERMPRD